MASPVPVLALLGLLLTSAPSFATPQFARTYGVDCSFCHVAPPKLNQRGEDFAAKGYRFVGLQPVGSRQTLPVAVWSTFDVERRSSSGVTKAFPGRVELISGGGVRGTPASYFVEWRALSQQVGGDGRLIDRSGRFEDVFVMVPLDRAQRAMLTVGQFRGLSQVDVSHRLSLSEPLAFSASVPDPRPASRPRLANVRAFSPAGRQPGVRLLYHREGGTHPADGWYSAVSMPLGGELTIPLAEASSFELEGRPKGVFVESYVRRGLQSAGGHLFVGDGRALGNVVATTQVASRLFLLGAVGFSRVLRTTDARISTGGEYVMYQRMLAGARIDHRTGQNRDPALLLYVNGHLPFGAPGLRQALRLQVEQRLQRGSQATMVALSHVF